MKNSIRKLIVTLFFLLLTFYILTNPKISLQYALTGLQLWLYNMIPTLLPFMILTGIMIRLNLTSAFVQIVKPILYPLFRLDDDCLYVIVIGFLCGFPMGARVVSQMYELGKLSKEKASLLLSFCNNIGPVYVTGFVMSTLHIQTLKNAAGDCLYSPLVCLIGMYALPFGYGLLLRHTVYRHRIPYTKVPRTRKPLKGVSSEKLLDSIDDSVTSGLVNIAKLGGYMILFNLLNIIPYHFLEGYPMLLGRINCMLEITSGIQKLGASAPLYVLILLPFGGFSCIAQTYSMIKSTDLSIRSYLFHKIALTVLTACYYFGIHTLL